MIDVLINADSDIIEREFFKLNLSRSYSAVPQSKEQLVSFLISYYGYDIFREEGMRHAFLSTLPPGNTRAPEAKSIS